MHARMDMAMLAKPGLSGLQRVEAYVDDAGLPEKLLDLLRLRVSQINGCAFCVDMHAHDLKRHGETDERIWAVAAWREAPFYDEAERAALALAEQATRLHDNPDGVSDAVWAAATERFTDTQLAALVVAIASINAWNRISIANRQVAGALRRRGPSATGTRPH